MAATGTSSEHVFKSIVQRIKLGCDFLIFLNLNFANTKLWV